jgi:hypothetical protein
MPVVYPANVFLLSYAMHAKPGEISLHRQEVDILLFHPELLLDLWRDYKKLQNTSLYGFVAPGIIETVTKSLMVCYSS